MLKKSIAIFGVLVALAAPVAAQGCVPADLSGVWNFAGSVVDTSTATASAEWVKCRFSVTATGAVRTTSKCWLQSDPATAMTFCAGGSLTVTTSCTVTGLIKTSEDGGVTCDTTRFRAGAMSRNHEVLSLAGQNAGGGTVSLVGMKQ